MAEANSCSGRPLSPSRPHDPIVERILGRGASHCASTVPPQNPVDRALSTGFAQRVTRALDARRQAESVLSYAWSLTRLEAPSHAHPTAKLKLTIETSAGSIAGSLCMFAHSLGPKSLALTGSTEALLLTSLFEKAWFPGEQGKSKTRGGANGVELLGKHRNVEIRHARAKGNNAYIDLTNDECRELIVALWGEPPEQRKAHIRQATVNRLVDELIAKLPNSKVSFRRHAQESLALGIKTIRHALTTAQGGYAFAKGDLDGCWEALEDLENEMQSANIVFDAALRDIDVANIIDFIDERVTRA